MSKLYFLSSFITLLHQVESFPRLSPHVVFSPKDVDIRRERQQSRLSLLQLQLAFDKQPDEEYRNAAAKLLSNFMVKEKEIDENKNDPLASIDFDAPKVAKLPIETLARALDAELYTSEWFVTGKVNPAYFADNFSFQDPDVKIKGIREYAAGVSKIFDQETARANIISTVVSNEEKHIITCTWRLSGKVNIGPGLTIKPYIVFTDFTVEADSGLIVFQEDRFDLPQWDILLSALFPFMIGTITSPPAPIPEPRDPPPRMPGLSTAARGDVVASPFDAFRSIFSGRGNGQ